jgi:hypothetical protein
VTEGARELGQEAGGMSRHTLAFALARVAGWLIVPLYVAGICTSYVLQHRAGLLDDNSVENALLLVGFSAFAVVGALLVAKRPTNAIGWIMAVVALMVSIFLAGDSYAAYMMVIRGQPDALAVFGAWIGGWYWYALLVLVLVYLPLLFPNGRMPSRRWLPVAVLTGVGTLGMIVLGALADSLHLNEAPGYRIAARLLYAFLKGVELACGVRFRWLGGVEHLAEVEEVLLVRRSFRKRRLAPLLHERLGSERHHADNAINLAA